MAHTYDDHPLFEAIGRLALEVEDGRAPPSMAAAFARFWRGWRLRAARAAAATEARNAILDEAVAELQRIRGGSVR